MNKLSLADASTAIQSGAVGIMPTDTVYGIAASAHNKAAVERLYALKNREQKPGTIIAASVEQLIALGINKHSLTRVEHYWPNPVSIEIWHDISYLHQGTGRQAFRIPKHKELRDFLAITGPLQTTSANQPSQPPATTLVEANHYFGDSVDFYVEGGDLSDREPSTIIKLTETGIEIIREGALKIDERGEIIL